MPGSSLWLVPPESHPLHGSITSLITSILPSRFPAEAGGESNNNKPVLFAPHMTLTSEISPATYLDNNDVTNEQQQQGDNQNAAAQTWLNSLPLPPARDVRVRLLDVATQDVFFRRCFVRVGYEGVREIVAVAREHGIVRPSAGGDAENDKSPPLSSRDPSSLGVRISETTEEWLKEWRQAFGPHVSLIYGSVPITDDKLSQISKSVEDAGVVLSAPGNGDSTEPGAGWDGGVVWLVPTDRPIPEWKLGRRTDLKDLAQPIATRTL